MCAKYHSGYEIHKFTKADLRSESINLVQPVCLPRAFKVVLETLCNWPDKCLHRIQAVCWFVVLDFLILVGVELFPSYRNVSIKMQFRWSKTYMLWRVSKLMKASWNSLRLASEAAT